MAKVKVSYGVTINLGNYESRRIDASLEFDVKDDDWEKCMDSLYESVRNKVHGFNNKNNIE